MSNKMRALRISLLALIIIPASIALADSMDASAIKKTLQDGCQAWIDGKAVESVDFYMPDVIVYDIAPPLQKTLAQVAEFNKQLSAITVGTPTCIYEEIHPVILTKTYAYSIAILYAAGTLKDGKSFHFRERSTDIWKKVDGKWRIMHEHNSVPVDVMSGLADLGSKP